ncbi:unnamed protein product [Calypogeia fissa]
MKTKAKVIDSIGCDADCCWDTAGLSSDQDTITMNHCAGVNWWQLTMGRLSRSDTIYSYERTKDSGYSEAKRSDGTLAKYSYRRSQQSKGDKMHLWTERKVRAPALNHVMTSNIRINGTTAEALAVLKNRLQRKLTTDSDTIC